MDAPLELLAALPDWLSQPVLAAIIAASLLMWTVIFERYLFILWAHPRQRRDRVAGWRARPGRAPLARRLRRQALLAASGRDLQQRLGLLQALVAVLPLLGLLGTVSGMALTFEVMGRSAAGAGGIGGGISQALISTLAGLVCALPGLYASADLRRRAQAAQTALARALEH